MFPLASRGPTVDKDLETDSSDHRAVDMPRDAKPADQDAPINPYPSWGPRFWHGMTATRWWKLLAANRFQVDFSRLDIATGVSIFTPVHGMFVFFQSMLFERRIRQTAIEHDPLFIIGHWRSGTTLLHELLVHDERFAYPNTFQCFAPDSFLLTEPWMVRLGGFLLPKQRPMDNMQAGWRLPQEDEFALMNLGIPTPYLRLAFPKTQDQMLEYLDMSGLDRQQLDEWKSGFVWFLKALTYHYSGKRLVLKSPTHTGRLRVLAEMFPRSRFIHLTRDPVKLYSSTLRLWRSLEEVQALQHSKPENEMQEYVISCLKRMYQQFESDRQNLDPARLVDVRYEDLAADPLGIVRELYERLDLGDFESVRPALAERLKEHHRYEPNLHAVDDSIRELVLTEWPDYAAKYGYDTQQPSASC